MGFYDQLAKYYDEVFPFNEVTHQFLRKQIDRGRVLDVGCSTGAYATKLDKEDQLIVKGIDLNEEMVKLANKRVGTASFEVRDMRDIDEKKYFDFIYSIDNTFAHLDGYDEIKSVLKILLDALKNDGILVIQIMNFARVFRRSVTELPLIETKHVKYSRYIQHKEGKILLKTVLKTKLDRFVSEVLFYPLTKAELEMMVDELKAKVNFYGSFKEEPFKEDSFDLIAVIKK